MLTKISRDRVTSPGTVEDPILADLIRQVSDSDVFRTAPMMRRLLLYLWENRGEAVSEYGIATEALGRASNFDSRTDASVRVQVARLRAKLAEFYAREGDAFPLQVRVPVGGHEIEWTLRVESVPVPPAAPAVLPAAPPVNWRNAFLVASSAAFLLAIVCAVLALRPGVLRVSGPAHPPLPRFWSTFLANGKPADIVIANLTGFRWADQHTYIIGPPYDFEKWRESPFLAGIAEKWGPPTLNQTYIFGRDAFAGFRIVQYLEQHAQQVQIVEGASYAAELQATHNALLIGRPSSSAYIRNFLEKTNFSLGTIIPLVVENRRPSGTELARYEEQQLSEKRRICPAILTLLPAKGSGARTLVLGGRYANIFSSLLLSDDGLKVVDDAWRKAGRPDAWEMIILAEIENNTTVVKTTVAAVRPIAGDFWN